MRKYILGFISVIIIGSIAGCGGNVESKDKATTKVEETSNETTYLIDEEETSLEEVESINEATTEIAEETTTSVAEQETTTKEEQTEKKLKNRRKHRSKPVSR